VYAIALPASYWHSQVALECGLYRILINHVLSYIYAAVLTISVSLFFNPLRRPLLYFYIGYILVAALTFRLRFGYEAGVFRLRYLSSSY